MADRSLVLRLTDMIEASERIRAVVSRSSLEEFEDNWERRWLVERGVLIISEASRHLSAELKMRHPEIPWAKVAGTGSVLRHDYERVAADIIWKLATVDLSGRIGEGLGDKERRPRWICPAQVGLHPVNERAGIGALEIAVARHRPHREELRIAVVAQVEHARETGRGVARLIPETVCPLSVG